MEKFIYNRIHKIAKFYLTLREEDGISKLSHNETCLEQTPLVQAFFVNISNCLETVSRIRNEKQTTSTKGGTCFGVMTAIYFQKIN